MLEASGTLGVTGASTLAAVGATNITASGTLEVIGASTLAGKLNLATGINCDVAILNSGTIVVSNTNVTANSIILLTYSGAPTNPGYLHISAKSAGTSFTITSSSNTDTSNVNWLLVN